MLSTVTVTPGQLPEVLLHVAVVQPVPGADIAGRTKVRGHGGTVQPGIDLLERAGDCPASGPILVFTDGCCDVLRIRREHAFLIPAGSHLPFRARGPVCRMS